MELIQLTDSLVLPVMAKHGIGREEAERRLQLLYQSSIIETGHPDDPETQQVIDGFLAQDSGVLAETVMYEKCFSECLSNKKFVKEYDRLSGRNLTKVLRIMEQEERAPSNAEKEFRKFGDFVRKTVFARWITQITQDDLPEKPTL